LRQQLRAEPASGKARPTAILSVLAGQPIPLYGDGLQVRDWVYAADHAAGILAAAHHGRSGEVYHLGGGAERTNRELADSSFRRWAATRRS